MSREFKFRSWDKINKVMYLNLQVLDSLAERISRPKEYHVMQYTGLKDKNGKEIYEGDYLEDRWGNRHAVVWNTKQAKFMYVAGCEYAIIIGNIYENPELLEEKK